MPEVNNAVGAAGLGGVYVCAGEKLVSLPYVLLARKKAMLLGADHMLLFKGKAGTHIKRYAKFIQLLDDSSYIQHLWLDVLQRTERIERITHASLPILNQAFKLGPGQSLGTFTLYSLDNPAWNYYENKTST